MYQSGMVRRHIKQTTGIQNLDITSYLNEKIFIPSKDVQHKIVIELDYISSKIRNIISETHQSIEELKKYKQSLITEAVTKGLDSNVKMKDSGIEWIGKIPKLWSVRKISNYFSQVKDKNDELEEENLLSLSYGSIIRRNINSTDGLLPANFKNYNIVKFGDIVLRMTDLQNDKVSLRTGFVTEDGIITSAYITIRTDLDNTVLPKYIQLLLHSFDIYKGFYGMGSGVRQNVTYNDIKKIEIIVPPLNEQRQIVSYLDEQTARIDKLIEDKTKVIEELEDYKKSLIYEYVTGKKEV
jgi:type I restriction enzyme S subunit